MYIFNNIRDEQLNAIENNCMNLVLGELLRSDYFAHSSPEKNERRREHQKGDENK